MLKILRIALKDVRLAFRDRAALILMFAAPLALTAGLGLVTGRFSGNASGAGLRDIPVAIINLDEGAVGGALINVLSSPELDGLLEPMTPTLASEARALVDADKVPAAIIIPAGFTRRFIPDSRTGVIGPSEAIELRVGAGRPIGAGIVRSVAEEFISRVEAARVSGQVSITRLLNAGLIKPAEAEAFGRAVGRQARQAPPITVAARTFEGATAPVFDTLAVLAPGMALLFLMYAVTRGAGALLGERRAGTLGRLFQSPTSITQTLAGKMLGTYLTALAQLGILIGGTTLIFNLRWGDGIALAALVIATALGATGWGALLSWIARTPAQAASAGTALMLTFAVLGGSFGMDAGQLPSGLRALGMLTPNHWGVTGFARLASSGTLPDLATHLGALCLMAVVTFAIATLLFRRAGFARRRAKGDN